MALHVPATGVPWNVRLKSVFGLGPWAADSSACQPIFKYFCCCVRPLIANAGEMESALIKRRPKP